MKPPALFPPVSPICLEAVKHAPSGLNAATIADLLGRNYNTLMSELGSQPGHKLGADLILPIASLTRSQAIMNFLARELGGVYVSVPALAGKNELVDSLLASVKEFGDFAAEAGQGIADGVLASEEYLRICKEGQEAMSAILQVMELARKAHENKSGQRSPSRGERE